MSVEAQVVARFRKRLDTAVDYHRELLLAIHNKTRQASLESMLVEQFVLYVAVLWETFVSDLMLTYLTSSPDTHLADMARRASQSLREKFGSSAAKCMTFSPPSKMSRSRVEAFVDPKGFNVGGQSADALSKRANALLSAPHAKRFTMSQDDSQFIDYLISLRNFLSHRSTGSRDELTATVKALAGANANLQAPVKDVAVYLKAKVGVDPRAVIIAERLKDIAATLG